MRNALRTLVLAIAAVGAPTLAAAAPCPVMTVYSKVLTPDGAPLPPGGGVVAIVTATGDKAQASHGLSATWQLGGAPAKATEIAPGLAVIAAPPGGKLTLTDAQHGAVASVGAAATDASAPLPAPTVKRIHRDDFAGRHPYTSITADLAGVPPKTAAVLVVLDSAGKIGRSWGVVDPTSTTVAVYATESCVQSPSPQIPSTVGDQVRFMWLDAFGRPSPKSAPVKVVAGPP